MDGIGQYIYSLVAAAVLVSILLSIIPDKGVASATISLATGMFLLIAVIAPVAKLRIANIQNYVVDIETDASTIINDAESYTNNKIVTVIKQQTESYILDKAISFGANIKVEVFFPNNDIFVPEKVQITGPISPLARRRLSAIIKEDLGIPEELQIWASAQ